MFTEEQRQQLIHAHLNQPKPAPELKEIADKIEEYHQAHYQQCFPAGFINEWVYKAIFEKIVQPLQAEINELKEKSF